jgi:Fe-S cluster assembly protein SufD
MDKEGTLKQAAMMDLVKEISLQDSMVRLFEEKHELIGKNDTPAIAVRRQEAFSHFKKLGFPQARNEKWRGTDLSQALSVEYVHYLEPFQQDVNVENLFKCEVPNFETYLVTQLNGWYTYRNSALKTLSNGMIVGSLAKAFEVYPDLVNKHYAHYADDSSDGMIALNTAFAQDGIFIYVPDNVSVKDTVQMVNIIDHDQNLFVQARNLIIIGKNSKLTLVQCDDSIDHKVSFINSVTEVSIGENATLDHYKLQNKDEQSTVVNTIFFDQQAGSQLSSSAISLNGGIIRNDSRVKMSGTHCQANIYGLYLMDKDQHIDNQVFVDHASPHCDSYELFKGILDDHASGIFNGHVLVRKDAQKTNAYQNNKNILLTDKAVIDSKPFLEIYADDVKCSHGATVGQLDSEAMFYIRSRGISETNARMLLMYAFAAEVVNKITIPELRQRIDDMVKKRLRGELSICDQCVLHCSHQEEKKIKFKIDMSKI